MRKLADLGRNVGFRAELNRASCLYVTQEQDPDRVDGVSHSCGDTYDLGCVVVLLGSESRRRVKPTPLCTAELPREAFCDDGDRDAVCLSHGDEATGSTRWVARCGAKEEVGDEELTHATLGHETWYRGEVIQIGMGDDHGIERADLGSLEARNHDRPREARRGTGARIHQNV